MSKTKATVVQLSSKAEPMEVGGGANDEEDEEEEPCDQCRVCTIRSDCFSYYNINEKLIFKNIRVAEALTMVTSIQILPDDELPQTICCRCEQRLLDAYHFRKLAESSARGFNRGLAKRPSTGSIGVAVTAPPVAAPAPVPVPLSAAPKPKEKPAIAATAAVRQSSRRPPIVQLAKPSKPVAVKPKAVAATVVSEHDQPAHQQLLVATKNDQDNAEQASTGAGNSMKLEMGDDVDTFKIVYLDELDLQRVVPVKLQRSPRVSSRTAVAQLKGLDKTAERVLDDNNEFEYITEDYGVEKEQVVQLNEVEQANDDDVDDEDDGVSFLMRSVEPSSEMTTDGTPSETPPKSGALKRTASCSPSRPTNVKSMAANSEGADATASTGLADQLKRRINNTRTPETHSEEYMQRKHICEVCGKRFIGRSNLVDHLRHHANVKLFKCDQCDKSFVQKGSLVCHMRTHTLERPFGCDVCGKTFSQASSRQIHVRQHTQERSYVCPLCEKAFYSNSDLTKHKRTHDAVMAYLCPHCPAGFAQRPNLKKHVLKRHPNEVWQVPAS